VFCTIARVPGQVFALNSATAHTRKRWVPFKKTQMRYIIWLLIFGFVITGCQNKKIITQEKTLIIQAIIDSTLRIDSGLNTKDYWIDFSATNFFDSRSINDYIKQNTNCSEINSDSLLKNDSTWIKYGFLQKILIEIKNVESKGDSITIDIDKIKATDGSNGLQIILKKMNGHYKVISSKMTWIS